MPPLVLATVLEPAGDSVVAVSACIDDHILRVVMRQMVVTGIGTEGKLQHTHSRKPQAVSKCVHAGGDIPQILGEKRHVSKSGANGHEQVVTGAACPPAMGCGLLVGRNLPVFMEPAEVIQSDDVHELESSPYPGNPPGVPGLAQDFPAVQRAAPSLSGGAEVIGWNSSHNQGVATSIELEQVRPRPHIGAVMGDEYRQIPYDGNLALLCCPAYFRPLLKETELEILLESDLESQSPPRRRERSRLALCQVGVPFRPGGAMVDLFESRNDLLGVFTDFKPKFTKRFAKLTEVAVNGIKEYVKEVKEGTFPDDDHSYTVNDAEYDKFAALVAKRKHI